MSHFVDYDLQPFAFRYTKLVLYVRCCLVQRERDSQHPSQRRDQEDQAESFIITTYTTARSKGRENQRSFEWFLSLCGGTPLVRGGDLVAGTMSR